MGSEGMLLRARRLFADTRLIIRTGEFGLSLVCIAGAWFSTDMTLVSVALTVGWLFAVAGIFSLPLTTAAKTAWAVSVGVSLMWIGAFFYHHTPPFIVTAPPKKQSPQFGRTTPSDSRPFVAFGPDYLIRLATGRSDIEKEALFKLYQHKWMKVEGAV